MDADYNHPESILAGDRNLVAGPAQSIYSAAGHTLRWSGIMHQFKGNLLFADGHVEESKAFLLAGGSGGPVAQNDLFIPSVKAEAGSSSPVFVSPGLPHQPSVANKGRAAPVNSTSNMPPANPEPAKVKGLNRAGKISTNGTLSTAVPPQNSNVVPVQSATNAVSVTPKADISGASFFDSRIVRFSRGLIGWGYLLLLLLMLLLLAFEVRRRWRQRPKN